MATPGKSRYRGWIGFLICLLLACVFWVIKGIADRNPDLTIVDYPVVYENMPANRAPVKALPDVIGLKVSAAGLSKIVLDDNDGKDTIVIDLGKLPGTGEKRYIVCSEILKGERRRLIRRGIKVLGPVDDSIPVLMAATVKKLIPVKPLLNLELMPDFKLLQEAVVVPPAVQVNAPKAVLDTLSYVYTEKLSATSVNHDLSFQSSLFCPGLPFVQTEPATVAVTVKIDRYIQGERTIPLLVNDPKNRNIRVYPTQIQLVYLAPMSRYNEVQSDMFRVEVDLPSDEQLPARLKVDVKVKPDFVKIIKTVPERVEYIIKK